MIGYIEALNTLHTRGYSMNAEDYMFALMVVVGNDEESAYAFAYDKNEMNQFLGTEEENEYLSKKKKDAESMLSQQNISHLVDLLRDSYRAEIQKEALDLKDYKFSGEETIQILNSLLKSRVEDIDNASVKDIVQVIKTLTEQGALETGDGGFSKHFVQIFPKFNALCPKCGREFDAMRGLSAKCPHCETTFIWSEEENRYYPEPQKL